MPTRIEDDVQAAATASFLDDVDGLMERIRCAVKISLPQVRKAQVASLTNPRLHARAQLRHCAAGLTELFQWHYHPDTNRDPKLTLRANLALPPSIFTDTIKRLDHFVTTFAEPDLVITTAQHQAPVTL